MLSLLHLRLRLDFGVPGISRYPSGEPLSVCTIPADSSEAKRRTSVPQLIWDMMKPVVTRLPCVKTSV